MNKTMIGLRVLFVAGLALNGFSQQSANETTAREAARPTFAEISRPRGRVYLRPVTETDAARVAASAISGALIAERPFPFPSRLLCNPARLPRPAYPLTNLGDIKVRASGTSLTWYFTDFLADHPNRVFTEQYFPVGFTPRTVLPPDAPPPASAAQLAPPPRHIPGEYEGQQAVDGLHDQQFSLVGIECSDRYGGSVNLRFVAEESLEYDARKAGILWDLHGLRLDLFVIPDYGVFNTARNAASERVYAEFKASDMVTYELIDPTNIRRIEVASSDHASDLETLWRQINASLRPTTTGTTDVTRFNNAASVFVYGLIHELFQDRLTGSDVVAMMELGDNHLDLTTRDGNPAVYVAARIQDIDFLHVDDDEEINVQLSVCWEPVGDLCTHRELKNLSNDESTSFRPYVNAPLSRCDANTRISIAMRSGTETDEDLEFISPPVFFAVNCADLQADVTAQAWGREHVFLVRGVRGENQDGEGKARANIELMLTIQNR